MARRPDTRRRVRADGGSMKIELYRLFHWVAITALVVWMVYSAYSAFIFS